MSSTGLVFLALALVDFVALGLVGTASLGFFAEPLAFVEHLALAFGEAFGFGEDFVFGEAFGFGEDFVFGEAFGFAADSVFATDLGLPRFSALGKVSAEPSHKASPASLVARRFLLHLRITASFRVERDFRLPVPDFRRPRGSASFLAFFARNWSLRVT